MVSKGRFIVIEGLEGAGKSTALHTVKDYLSTRVPEIIHTREPGGTRAGETIRHLIKEVDAFEPLNSRAELLLMYAARIQLIEHVIRPALERGCWVIADRFELSTWAYQGGGRKLSQEMIGHLSTFSLRDFKPDLIIFLDITPEQGLKRARKRGKLDRIEQESLAFFQAVYDGYHEHIKMLNNVVQIDASQPLATVQQMIRDALQRHVNG